VVNPFYNTQEQRLRAFWRLLLQLVLVFGIGFAVGWLMSGTLALLGWAPSEGGGTEILTGSTIFLVANSVASLVAVVASIGLAGRFLDRRPFFSGFGLRLDRDWWLDFCFGLFLGALLMTGIFLVELVAGWVMIVGTFEAPGNEAFFPIILMPLVLFLCVGISEELLSRGYQITNIAEGLNFPSLGGPKVAVVLAWVISSSLFGLGHLSNPNATVVSTLNIALAGLLLGLGYVLTGRLAIPIGLHITWNFFQGNVFGFPVSGLEPVGATVLSIEQGGPLLFTGGVFGPEAGLIGIAAILAGGLLILLWVRVRSGKAALVTSIAEPPPSLTEVAKAPEDG
jgi:membrane protease YdiL (CAAX protease family)